MTDIQKKVSELQGLEKTGISKIRNLQISRLSSDPLIKNLSDLTIPGIAVKNQKLGNLYLLHRPKNPLTKQKQLGFLALHPGSDFSRSFNIELEPNKYLPHPLRQRKKLVTRQKILSNL